MDKRKAAAFLIGCSPEELINFRQEGEEVVTLGPDGKKYRFSNEQLEKASKAASMTKTLAAIAVKAERQAEQATPRPAKAHAPEPRAERSPKVKTQSPSKTGKSSKSSGSSRSSKSSKNS